MPCPPDCQSQIDALRADLAALKNASASIPGSAVHMKREIVDTSSTSYVIVENTAYIYIVSEIHTVAPVGPFGDEVNFTTGVLTNRNLQWNRVQCGAAYVYLSGNKLYFSGSLGASYLVISLCAS